MLLIPSFAIGRTQEIVWELTGSSRRAASPQLPLYLDSPMAKSASDVYRAHPEAYDEETAQLLAAHEAPLDYPGQHVVQTVQESQAIARAPPPYVIVASNGMLTGGRSVGHAERPARTTRRPRSCSSATRARARSAGTSSAAPRRRGSPASEMQVRATIRSLDGFSAHADEPELLGWLRGFIGGRKAGRPGRPARRLPRPRRPARPGRAGPEGRGARAPRRDPRLAPDGVARLGLAIRRVDDVDRRRSRASTRSNDSRPYRRA